MIKNVFLAILLVFSILTLSSCIFFDRALYEYDDVSEFEGISREDHEGYTVFNFDNFSGVARLAVSCENYEESNIYYYAELSSGEIEGFYDLGIYYTEKKLFDASADGGIVSEMNEDTVKSWELIVIFEADSETPATGEVIISFLPTTAIKHGVSLHEHKTAWEINTDGHILHYLCDCDYRENLENHIDEDENSFCDICDFYIEKNETIEPDEGKIYLCDNITWLGNLTPSSICEIKTVSQGINSGDFIYFTSTKSQNAIWKYLEALSAVELYLLDENDILLDGEEVSIHFELTDGTIKKLNIYNDICCCDDGKYYKMSSVPKLPEDESHVNYNGFAYSIEMAPVYSRNLDDGEEVYIGDVSLRELVFIYDIDFDPGERPYIMMIATDFGNLYFFSEQEFIFNGVICRLYDCELTSLIN